MTVRDFKLSRMKFKRAVLLTVLLLVIGMLGYIILYPEIKWRYRMTGMLREAPYVRLYDDNRNLVAEIEERETILRLWRALDLWNRRVFLGVSYLEQQEQNPMVGFIDYPTELEFGEEKFHYPIYVFSDGQAQWGITPDSRHWFWSKELKDEILRLLNEYSRRNKDN